MNEPTWGDVVRVNVDPEDRGLLGSIGSVCGIRVTSGGRLILVEFGDGEAFEFWSHHLTTQDLGSAD